MPQRLDLGQPQGMGPGVNEPDVKLVDRPGRAFAAWCAVGSLRPFGLPGGLQAGRPGVARLWVAGLCQMGGPPPRLLFPRYHATRTAISLVTFTEGQIADLHVPFQHLALDPGR